MDVVTLGAAKAFSKKGQSKALGDNSLCLYGDSITDFYANISSGTPNITYSQGISYARQMQLFARNRFKITAEYGVAGETMAQIRARVATVIADPARNVFLLAGINSITSATPTPTADIISDNKAIWDALQAAGKRVIQPTIMLARQITTAAQRLVFDQVNAWIMSEGPKRGIIVIPWHHLWADPVDGKPHGPSQSAPWTTIDGTHPSSYGAALMGKYAADILAPLFPANGAQLTYSNADSANAITNGMMVNTAGTGLLNAVTNSAVADGWKLVTSVSQVATPTIVASTDGLGNWQRVQITAGTVNSGSCQFSFDATVTPAVAWAPSTAYALNATATNGGVTYKVTTAGTSATSGGPSGMAASITDGTVVWTPSSAWAVGDSVVARVEIDTDADFVNASKLQLDLAALTAGFSTLGTVQGLKDTSSTQDIYRIQVVNGVIETPPLVIPATTGILQFKLFVAGLNGTSGTTATYRVRRAGIHKVPTP
jgi:lysophospholipase L1-like esterase